MKKLLVLALAFILTGCAALAPAPTAAPTTTPQIVIQTVVVTVLVTVPPSETPVPSATWTPIPTFTPQPTSLTTTPGTPMGTGTAETPAANGSPSATLPADAGGGLFTNLTRSGDQFAFNCQPDTITFGVSTANTSVTEVDLFYRLEYKQSSSITNWVDIGKMQSDNTGNFTYDFKTSLIPSDLRGQTAWFDYQFVGLNNLGQVVGRSARILQQVSYSPKCP